MVLPNNGFNSDWHTRWRSVPAG